MFTRGQTSGTLRYDRTCRDSHSRHTCNRSIDRCYLVCGFSALFWGFPALYLLSLKLYELRRNLKVVNKITQCKYSHNS